MAVPAYILDAFPQNIHSGMELFADWIREGENIHEIREDIHDLKSAITGLVVAQTKTEEKLDNLAGVVASLADAQKRTEEKLDNLTGVVASLANAQKRTEEKLDNLTGVVASLAENQNQMQKAITNLAKQVGGLSESFGASLEDFAMEIVPELLEKYWNMKIESSERDFFFVEGREIETDFVIRGKIDTREIVVLGECKSNLTETDARKFFKQVEKIKPTLPNLDVRIVFFGYRFSSTARDFIKESGASMVFTRGTIFQ